MKTFTKFTLLTSILFMFVYITSCSDDDETTFSDNLRVLKVTSGDDRIENGAIIDNDSPVITIVFSHGLNTTAFEDALNINTTNYTVSYDATQSFATLSFGILDFDATYTITVPEGNYGADGEVIQEDFTISFNTAEFVPPALTISANPESSEEGGSIDVTVSINEAILFDITGTIVLGGDAILDSDYSISSTDLLIPAGETSFTTTIAVLNDGELEGEEIVELSFENLTNSVYTSDPFSISLFDQIPKITLKGVMELEGFNAGAGRGRAVHLYVREDIEDLSIYGLGVANNGGGTDGVEFTFPAQAATAGDHIFVVRDLDEADVRGYFGGCFDQFNLVIATDAMTQNGDDAIELFQGTIVIETFGDADVDGTGMEWEYSNSWAYKLGGEWIYGGPGCTTSADMTTTQTSNCEYPFCSNPIQLQGLTSLKIGGTGTNGRSIHLRANQDIPDLSVYGIGIANNGGGSDGREINLPAIAVSEGDHILFSRDIDVENLTNYFEGCINKFDHIIPNPTGDDINFNGDDPVELFENDVVIETYGDVALDGTGEVWEWTGSWAYKVASVWTYGGVDCAAGATTNSTASCSYTFCDE